MSAQPEGPPGNTADTSDSYFGPKHHCDNLKLNIVPKAQKYQTSNNISTTSDPLLPKLPAELCEKIYKDALDIKVNLTIQKKEPDDNEAYYSYSCSGPPPHNSDNEDYAFHNEDLPSVSYTIAYYPLPLFMVTKQVYQESVNQLAKIEKIVKEAVTDDGLVADPTPGFLSLCQTRIELELNCDMEVFEVFVDSLSSQVVEKTRSLIIAGEYVPYQPRYRLVPLLEKQLPQLEEVELGWYYSRTWHTETIVQLVSLLDKGFLCTVRLYILQHFSCDSQSNDDDRGLQAVLLDLHVDSAQLERNSYLEVVRCEDLHDGARCPRKHSEESLPKFYSGTASDTVENQCSQKIKLSRIYRHVTISTKEAAEIATEGIEGGDGSLVEARGVEAPGEAGEASLESVQPEDS